MYIRLSCMCMCMRMCTCFKLKKKPSTSNAIYYLDSTTFADNNLDQFSVNLFLIPELITLIFITDCNSSIEKQKKKEGEKENSILFR